MRQLLLCLAAFLAFTVAFGQTTFQKTYGGTGNDFAKCVLQTSDGGYLIAGSTTSYGAGGSDAYLIKTDNLGGILWTQTSGGTGGESFNSIIQASDGNFVLTGLTWVGSDSFELLICKKSITGSTLWSKSFGIVDNENGVKVLQTPDGGFIVAGGTFSYATGNQDIYLIKTDANGNTLWSKKFGGTGQEIIFDLKQTLDGGFIIAGETTSYGPQTGLLFKINALGNTQWCKTFGGGFGDWGRSVLQASDGGFIIVGGTASFGVGYVDVLFIKTDSNGNLLWSKTYGDAGYNQGTYVLQTADGGYIIAGVTDDITNGLFKTASLIKTDPNGDTLWAKSYNDSLFTWLFYIKQTVDGGFITCGSTYYNVSGPNINSDVYLIKTTPNGSSGCDENSRSLSITNPNLPYSTQTLQVSSGGGNASSPPTTMGSGGSETIFCFASAVNEVDVQNQINVFPNPFSTETTLQTDWILKNATLTLYNSFGQAVKSIDNLYGPSITLHRDNLPIGLYFIRITQGSEIFSADKLVILD